MKHKKILSKAAFAALLVAANMPVDGQVEATGIQETFLASSGCSSCGGGRRSEIADNSSNTDMYNARTNSYQTTQNSYSATGNSAPSLQGNSGNASSNVRQNNAATAGNASSTGAWKTSGNAATGNASNTSAWKTSGNAASQNASNSAWKTSGNAASENSSFGNATSGNTVNSNRPSNGSWNSSSTSTTGQPAYDIDMEVQRSGRGYNEEYSRSTSTMGNETITEEELLVKLTPQARADYMSMDTKGKAMALQLASQSSFKDKNMAVKEAQRRSSQQGMSNRY
ncbi:MAG: hypothetical protein H0V82_03920 [Candidatus Protochlamydia sp.]|nr:hypothetical protein [Candidatus Protochlamydia sp.]